VDDPDGETPAVTPLLRVDLIMGDEGSRLLMVHSVDGEKHDVSKGDVVRFQRRDGRLMEGSDLIVSEVLGPFQFSASVLDGDGHRKSATDVIQECIDQEAVAFRRAKVPRVLSFEPLERAAARALTDPSLFTPSDLDKSFDDTRRRALFKSFQAISEFVNRYAQLPQSSGHIEAFVGLAAGPDEMGDTVFLDHCRRFAAACAAKFTPIQCVFGAVGAQEALKAISGLYTPTRQFLMYDTDEILPSDVSRTTEKQDSARHQSPGLRYILGDALVDALQKQRVFVVGAGAIGCELLKNLAAMGVATKSKGRIHLTDMDTIEKSNLSRQLLFRDSDIGAFKSSAAHKAALRFNPALRIESHSSKVGETGRSPFNAEFWSKKVDIVLNALDNVDARLFMDRQCVANKKALVDAGTMGPKGNVQVVVPDQSESYASSVDPPEPAVPVCTLKHFPYAIAHTIQWGRDLFDGLFTRRPAQANEFLEHVASSSLASYAKQMMNQKGEEAALQAAEELSEDFALISRTGDANDLEAARREALNWATRLAISLFFDSAVQLMKEHPMESLDEDGEPFWTGTRRPPKALMFASSDFSEHSTTNEHLIEFVRTAARLRLETLLPSLAGKAASSYTVDEAVTALETPQSAPELVPTNATVAKRIQLLLGGTKQTTPLTRYSPIEFEKDDDTNGHVAFVNAASNLRAIAYGIPPVEALETRRVAGNIVPAVSASTESFALRRS
jgi:ubiquitin-activating enzyme E1